MDVIDCVRLRRLSMADEGMEEMNGKIEELVLDNEPYDEDENVISCMDQQQEQDDRKERPQLTAQEERRLKIQRCIQSLVHATNCPEVNCSLPSCTKMKRVVEHAKICKRKTGGGCGVCKELVHLGCYHAKQCEERECTVPFWGHIKLKQQQQTQQRFAQSQTLRRRMATTQRQSMQPQPQMPGQNMPPNVGVAAGMGQSHQTLQPQPQFSQVQPGQQGVPTVGPQTALNSGLEYFKF
ncbi:CREB-binding protein-like [Acropora millepora]|uniref:CREB-binding protein-like n=1 Tax=Acropora millepora TaxID=45264 RepID=UPI001CF5B07E|nr:CREB-binding protein-like [Acropora millepora]